MPSFSAPNEVTGAALEKAIERAGSWRDRDPIVFDVRTNGGGSSEWGRRLLAALYGEDVLNARYEPLVAKEYVEWRVSPGNVEHTNTTIVAATARVYGTGSAAARRGGAGRQVNGIVVLGELDPRLPDPRGPPRIWARNHYARNSYSSMDALDFAPTN
jgi:hypothetical protein